MTRFEGANEGSGRSQRTSIRIETPQDEVVANQRIVAASTDASPLRTRQEVRLLREASGFVICDHDGLDRAGDWTRCSHGPDCPYRAHFVSLYPTAAAAVDAIGARADEIARAILPSNPGRVLEDLELSVRYLDATRILGRDYRNEPADMSPVLAELRGGAGDGPHWLEMKRQRDDESVEGVLLPGTTDHGRLFVFARAPLITLTPVLQTFRAPF